VSRFTQLACLVTVAFSVSKLHAVKQPSTESSGRSFLVVLQGGGAARTNSQTSVRSDGETAGTIKGTVVNKTTSEPLSGITVAATTDLRAVTDSLGQFVIKDVPAGRHRLTASGMGFIDVDQLFNGTLSVRNVVNLRPKDVAQVSIELVQSSAIYGRVSDMHGPVGSARVRLRRRTFDRSGGTRVAFVPNGFVSGGITDEKGNYRIFNIPQGEYYVSVSKEGTAVPTFYPNGQSLDVAVPIRVSGSAPIGNIDIMIPERPTYSLRATLDRTNLGKEIPVTFALRPLGVVAQEPFFSRELKPTHNDEYEISGIPSGSYELGLSWLKPDGGIGAQRLPVTVMNDHADVGKVEIGRGTVVSGRVTNLSNVPTRISSVTLFSTSTDIGGMAVARVESDGSFRFNSVSKGKYLVSIGASSETYIASVRVGGQDLLGTGIQIAETDPGPIEVSIDGPRGAISGTVTNAKNEPQPNVWITLIPTPDRRANANLYILTATDHSGSFTLKNVPPGEYGIAAWPQLAEDEHKSAEWLRTNGARLRAITIERSVTTAADLRLNP
jgi:hypothetical protein